MSKRGIYLFWQLSWITVLFLYLIEHLQRIEIGIGLVILSYFIGRYTSKAYTQFQNGKVPKENPKDIDTDFKQDMKRIFAFYQYVNSLPPTKQQAMINQIICQEAIKMTDAEMAFVWLESCNNTIEHMVVMPKSFQGCKEKISNWIEKTWEESAIEYFPKRLLLEEECYLLIPLITDSRKYGVIGIKCDAQAGKEVIDYLAQKIRNLAKWSSVIIERVYLEKVSINLAIEEEKKRIANEIHDGVAQRLFGVTSAAFSLKANSKYSESRIKEQLELISDSANKAMQELRLIIYGLSRRQETQINYFENVREYLKDAAHLHQIDIDVELNGNENNLDLTLKRAILRIIKEATGNSIRHGHSTQINVLLEIGEKSSDLYIKDNGQGFDYNAASQMSLGLGLKNIQSLMSILQGELAVESSKDKGTSIHARIPLERVREVKRKDLFIGGVAS